MVPAAVHLSFAMAVLEVAQLVAATYVESALLFLRALFYLWSASCYATEHTFEFDILKQETLGCVYTSHGWAGGGSAGGGGLCGIRSFILAGVILLVVVVVVCHR